MNSKNKTLTLMGILAFIVLAFLVSLGFREISRARSSCGDYGFVTTPCSQLPTIAEAEKGLNQHKNKVNQIENVNPNQISVSVQVSKNCTGKGIILITHPSENDCESLRRILGDKFFGIPYKIINN